MKLKEYKLYCLDEQAEKTVILKDTDPAPTLCPANSAHPIAQDSVSIKKVYDTEIKPVRQVLGEDDLYMNPRGMSFTAPAGQVSNHDLLLEVALAVRGGVAEFDDATRGDWMRVLVIDKTAATGLPNSSIFQHPDYQYTSDGWPILNLYVPYWSIFTRALNELMDVSIGKLPVPGLFMRVEYHSTGQQDVTASFNLISYLMEDV